jgi:phage FluMu gp28-like protein
MSQIGWRLIKQLGRQIPGSKVRLVDRLVDMPGNGNIQVRSADNPDSLRGEGLDFVVLDECAFMKEDAWTHAIRPALSDRQGEAMFISTPKGRNWFFRLYQLGQDDLNDEWASWHFPTSDNPYIPDDEIEAARKGMPERIYQQEFLALFLDDAGGVFRRVMEAATATIQEESVGGHQYSMGVDWGRHEDFTVLTLFDMTTKEVVATDRYTQIDYGIQINRLKAMYERFHPVTIVAELNSMGGPLVEQLLGDGLPVQGFQTTNTTKEQIIRDLEGAFERGEIRIPNDPVLIGELQAYEQERLPAGKFRFNAPSGMHDDHVISLALAWSTVPSSWWAW